MWKKLLEENNMSIYKLAKNTGISYSALHDLVSGKKKIENCSVSVLKKLSDAFHLSMDELYKKTREKLYCSVEFDLFRSNVCHDLKRHGELGFILKILEERLIDNHWNNKEYFEAFYLLAMLDYLSKRNSVELCQNYNRIRIMKLPYMIYPTSVVTHAKVLNIPINKLCKDAISEFLKYNIMEGDVFDVA